MAAVVAAKQLEALSHGLDRRLYRFFKKYPPVLSSSVPPTSTSTPLTDSPTPDSTSPSPSESSTMALSSPATIPTSAATPTLLPYQGPNPFVPHKFAQTGRWHEPKYSLRRQADLMHAAEAAGLEDLMPPSMKARAYRNQRREELGLRVKGTGVGERVKGHYWERSLYQRLEKRRKAMLEMPELIYQWKKLGHGKGWKKWPK